MIGKRHNQLNHTQIRLDTLDTLETPHHYFFLCPQLTQQRNILFSKLKNIINDQQHFTTRLLLFGSEQLDSCNNSFIFQYVHGYLEKTTI